jgi:HK97 family phage portal protein
MNPAAGIPGTRIDYAGKVGDGLASSVVMAPIQFIQRTFPEAFLELARARNGKETIHQRHSMLSLIEKPNDYYSGQDLWSATIFSYLWGDAYWRIVRGGGRRPDALYYVPSWEMEPRGTKTVLITHYRHTAPGTVPEDIPREDVIHFRNGINPRNLRVGLSQLFSALREIFGDAEASNYTAALLKNFGVPGVVMSPDMSDPGALSSIDVDAVRAYLKQKFSGDSRGEPFVSSLPVKLHQFGFDPKQMVLKEVRDLAEERVCAAIGISPAVVGFGSGLEQTAVGATMTALIALAWQSCIIPIQRALALTLQNRLLPEFEPRPDEWQVRWNRSKVAALQESRMEAAKVAEMLYRGDLAKRSEARGMVGLEVTPEDEGYRSELEPDPMASLFPTSSTGKAWKAFSKAATQQQRDMIARLDADRVKLESEFDSEMLKFLEDLGADLARVSETILKPKDDRDIADEMLRAVDMGKRVREFVQTGQAQYVKVAQSTYRAIASVLGVALDLPDATALKVIAEGGRRMGLSDLLASTRKKLTAVLEEGRRMGQGPAELARTIRDTVPAGPWTTPAIRAKVIARTETLHAQRYSTLSGYRDSGRVDAILIYDARLGDSDPECEARNGTTVSFDAAAEMMAEEHPNGSLAFAPVIP